MRGPILILYALLALYALEIAVPLALVAFAAVRKYARSVGGRAA
jgi:hypothetical protein